MRQRDFVATVLELYTQLAGTPERPAAADRRLARQWFRQGVPLPKLRAALWLATARHTHRPAAAVPLQPIRSLYYFVPVLDEILSDTFDPDYLQHLQSLARAQRPGSDISPAQQRRHPR